MQRTHPRVLAVVNNALRQIDLVKSGGERRDFLHDVPRNHGEHAHVEQKQQGFDTKRELNEGGERHHGTWRVVTFDVFLSPKRFRRRLCLKRVIKFCRLHFAQVVAMQNCLKAFHSISTRLARLIDPGSDSPNNVPTN